MLRAGEAERRGLGRNLAAVHGHGREVVVEDERDGLRGAVAVAHECSLDRERTVLGDLRVDGELRARARAVVKRVAVVEDVVRARGAFGGDALARLAEEDVVTPLEPFEP